MKKKFHLCEHVIDTKNEPYYKFGGKYIHYDDEGSCVVQFCNEHYHDPQDE